MVEFWLRFDTALEEQRHKELQEDHVSLHTMPMLKTSWAIEKHSSEVFTHEIFLDFQHELLADRDHYLVEMMTHEGEVKTVTIRDGYKKLRVVTYNTTTMVGSCTCKLFETHGIPCRHLIHVLRTAQLNELPKHYVLKRFRKDCKTEPVFDEDGILLEGNESSSIDPEIQKLASETFKKMEDLLVQAKQSQVSMQFLRDHIFALGEQLSTQVPAKKQTQTEEFEEFLGCSIPSEVHIHPPNDI